MGDGSGRLLKLMQAGKVSSGTMVANTDKTISVSFLEPFATADYSVSCIIRNSSGNPDNFHAVATNYSASGFDIIFRRTTGTATVNIDWTATYQTQ